MGTLSGRVHVLVAEGSESGDEKLAVGGVVIKLCVSISLRSGFADKRKAGK